MCSLLAIYLGPNYVGGNEDNGDLSPKIPDMYCYSLSPQFFSRPPLTQAFTGDFQTPIGKSPVGSLFLSPGSWCTKFCCALQESISQSCVSSGSSIVGLITTSSKRTYAIPTPRAPVPETDHCRPVPPQETLKHSSLCLCGVPGSWCTQGLFEPSECLWQECSWILNVNSLLLLSCWASLCPWTWGISSQPL